MNDALYKEEKIYFAGKSQLCAETYDAIRSAIQNNHAVGFVAGYYDENLKIAYVSEIFLNNLGYSYEEFMTATSESLKKVFYGSNCTFVKNERFKKLQGIGEVQILSKEGIPVNFRAYKTDTVDSEGTAMWVVSVHMNQMQEQLKLVNKVISSGFWSIDFDEDGEPVTTIFSNEFRRMLGYHDVLDFPNKLEAWENALHPDDRDRVEKQFRAAFKDKTNQSKYDVEYRMRMAAISGLKTVRKQAGVQMERHIRWLVFLSILIKRRRKKKI